MTRSEQQTSATQQDGPASVLREVRFEYTPQFPRVLESLGSALLVSTYQAGRLLVIGVEAGRLSLVTYGRFERGRISEGLYQRMDMQGLVAADSDQNIAMAVGLCLVGSLRTLLPAADSEERQPRPRGEPGALENGPKGRFGEKDPKTQKSLIDKTRKLGSNQT